MEKAEVKKQRRTVDWSNLPEKAVVMIGFYLSREGSDYRKLRGVCRKWRKSSAPSTHFLGWSFPREFPTQLGRPVYLISTATYLLYPSEEHYYSCIYTPWLVTVDELNPGKLRLRHPLTAEKFDLNDCDFPKSLNLLDFWLVEVHIGHRLCLANGNEDVFSSQVSEFCRNCPIKTKTLLFGPDSVAILSLDRGGILGFLKFNGEWRFSELGANFKVDDIIDFDGDICAVNHRGQALLISSFNGRVIKELSQSLSKSDAGDKRKHLAVYDNEVYLIVRGIDKFFVYKLNEELHKWERIYDLGNLVLFVTYDTCFFLIECELPEISGNCIFFPKNCFPTKSGDNSADDELFQNPEKYLEVAVFFMDTGRTMLVSSEVFLSDIFWKPPEWLDPDFKYSSFSVGNKDQFLGSANGPDSCTKEYSSATSKRRDNGQGAENPSGQKITNVQEVVCENNDRSVPATNSLHQDSGNDAAEKSFQGTGVILDLVPLPRIPSPKLVNVDSLPLNTSAIKIAHDCASLEKFQGVDVSSTSVSVLQKIWDKHGNIIEGHMVHSNGLLTWALESLANMILILEKNTGDSLNNSQAEYLNSTLADLKMMQFRLDWLVPLVERAMAAHKSKFQKGIMINLETRKSKLLAEMREVEEQMAQQEKLMAESLISCAPSVLEKGLAEGLY